MKQSAGGPTQMPPGTGDGGDGSGISMPTIADAAAAGAVEAAPACLMAQPSGQAVGAAGLGADAVQGCGIPGSRWMPCGRPTSLAMPSCASSALAGRRYTAQPTRRSRR